MRCFLKGEVQKKEGGRGEKRRRGFKEGLLKVVVFSKGVFLEDREGGWFKGREFKKKMKGEG